MTSVPALASACVASFSPACFGAEQEGTSCCIGNPVQRSRHAGCGHRGCCASGVTFDRPKTMDLLLSAHGHPCGSPYRLGRFGGDTDTLPVNRHGGSEGFMPPFFRVTRSEVLPSA